MKVVTVERMRAIERQAGDDYGLTSEILMANAGRGIAEIVRGAVGGDLSGMAVLVLVGPGNNGGDGRVAAQHLAEAGAQLGLFVWKDRQLLVAGKEIPVEDDLETLRPVLEQTDVVLDALLGTGHARPLDPLMRQVLALVDAERARRPALVVAAVDLPSGLDADTGAADPGTLRADLTITLAFPKVGMFIFPGAGTVGELVVGPIGLPEGMAGDVSLEMLDGGLARTLLPARPLESNKGTYGKVMVLAGSPPYPGSAYLAATAAGRAGAGLVTLAVTTEMAAIYAVKLSETTFRLLPPASAPAAERARVLLDGLDGYSSLLVGPGLGQDDATRDVLLAALDGVRTLPDDQRPRLIVDADGLNMLARVESWWERLPPRTVITPHPGEMTRLRGGERVSGGGADRFDVVRDVAARWGTVTILKGACTLIADPAGAMRVYWPPNPALATAGTGDVLAGIVAGLLAQGADPFDAASLAVYLHGRAGLAVSEQLGDAGLLASDLLPEIPVAMRETREGT